MSINCLQSKCVAEDVREQREINRKIDVQLEKERHEYKSTHRLLLTGTFKSGRRTIINQMRILHIDGFKSYERQQKILDIKRIIRDAILAITNAMKCLEPPLELEKPEHESKVEYIRNVSVHIEDRIDDEFFDSVECLWKDSGVQACYKRANEYDLIDSAKYFLDQVSVIRKKEYTPTDQDVLRCRIFTRGIFETKFCVDHVLFHMFDVRGCRNQACKKWLQCFSDVDAMIFVIPSSYYDVVLNRDRSRNRLTEAIEHFNDIVNYKWLRQVDAILFLNKIDLLRDKILSGRSPLEYYFPDFVNYTMPTMDEGTVEYDVNINEDVRFTKAKYFIRDQFLKRFVFDYGAKKRNCFSFFTCAVDTENIRRIFNDCRDILQRKKLFNA